MVLVLFSTIWDRRVDLGRPDFTLRPNAKSSRSVFSEDYCEFKWFLKLKLQANFTAK